MATLDDSFLEDLEDLEEDDEVDEQAVESTTGGASGTGAPGASASAMKVEGDGTADGAMKPPSGFPARSAGQRKRQRPGEGGSGRKIAAGLTLADVATLPRDPSFLEHMRRIERAMAQDAEGRTVARRGLLEGDPLYKLIVDSNTLMVKVKEEVSAIHALACDLYKAKFPELADIVHAPLDYLRVVKRIGRERDVTTVDLADLLPAATIMVVSVSGSATNASGISDEDLGRALEACDEALKLAGQHDAMLRFVESRMSAIAPNVSALVGSRVAAQLVGMAGGLDALARIPSCNTQVLGQDKGSLHGFSAAAALRHMGVIYECELVQKASPDLRRKAVRVVSGKLALCARVDAHGAGAEADGALGDRFRAEIAAKIDKWMEPAPGKTKKALPKPDEKPRRKRGGRRARKLKERYGLTEMAKQASRRTFGDAITDEYGDDAMGHDLGMLGREGSGALRLQAQRSNYTSKKMRKAINTGGTSNGLASSVAFTPVQGLELANPEAAAKKIKEANDKYFGTQSGFFSVVKK